VYNGTNLQYKSTLRLPKPIQEGWGFTTLNRKVGNDTVQESYISDGSANIYIVNPITLEVQK